MVRTFVLSCIGEPSRKERKGWRHHQINSDGKKIQKLHPAELEAGSTRTEACPLTPIRIFVLTEVTGWRGVLHKLDRVCTEIGDNLTRQLNGLGVVVISRFSPILYFISPYIY